MADNEYGPFATEQDVWATEACAAERAHWEANPVPGEGEKWNTRFLLSACEELGIELGGYDLSPLRQVAMYEPAKCVALRGIIQRAFEAGKAAACEEPAAVEWGIVRPEGGSGSDVWGCGRDAEALVRQLLQRHRSIHGDGAGWLVTREIGQWKKVPERSINPAAEPGEDGGHD